MVPPMTAAHGRIDIHAHLLPGVDDGCQDIAESLACARRMVEAGFTDLVCTPHVWPNMPHNNPRDTPPRVAALQRELDRERVPLRLHVGGEINLRDHTADDVKQLLTYQLGGRHVLIDFWFPELPDWFDRVIGQLQQSGLTVIIAHPERIECFQRNPEIIDALITRGVLLQANLQCLPDPVEKPTRLLAERWLRERRYTFLASDLHRLDTLQLRLDGLQRAIELLGDEEVDRLTRLNPRQVLTQS
jgi:protein-tyrosine phosphatase